MSADPNTPDNPDTRALVAEAALLKLVKAIDGYAFSPQPIPDEVFKELTAARAEAIYVLERHGLARSRASSETSTGASDARQRSVSDANTKDAKQ